MDKVVTPILVRYGGAKKSCFEMNKQELEVAAISIFNRAKENAFYKGLPIYYVENNSLIAEYGNGHIEVVKKY